MTLAELNSQYGQRGLDFVQGAGGLIFAEIDNAGGSARICLQGAHIISWKPRSQSEPVIWVSDMARYAEGKAIRGGVPVCWPWFGPHESESSFPQHGFARISTWQVADSEMLANGDTRVKFILIPNDQSKMLFSNACQLELVVTVGETLQIDLVTTNLDTETIHISEALHAYFQIHDIGKVSIDGLDGVSYLDQADANQSKKQNGVVVFSKEVDRVYQDTASDCYINDPDLRRRICIAKSNSLSTVVWNPWVEKSEKMGDLGAGRKNQGGWREMVCVESGNALDNLIEIPSKSSHTLSVIYSVAPL